MGYQCCSGHDDELVGGCGEEADEQTVVMLCGLTCVLVVVVYIYLWFLANNCGLYIGIHETAHPIRSSLCCSNLFETSVIVEYRRLDPPKCGESALIG